MKYSIPKLTLVFVLVMFMFKGFSQKLTFTDLKYLLEHNIESADTYITGKGFKYHEVEKGENGSCDNMIWSFDRNIDNDRAVSFIAKNCYQADHGLVWYQFGDKLTFDKIKIYCKVIGFKPVETKTDPFNDLCTTFESTKYEIEFCSGVNKGTNKNEYTITLNYSTSSVIEPENGLQ